MSYILSIYSFISEKCAKAKRKMHNSYPRILTDETSRENVSHGDEKYPFMFYLEDIYQFDFHCIDWHWHPEFEFVYIEKGTVSVSAGNHHFTLTAGEGIFINSQIIHRFVSAESAVIPNIVFSPSLLAPKESLIYLKYIKPILSSSADIQIFTPDVRWQKECLAILNSVFKLQNDDRPCEIQTVQLLLKLWQIMYENMETDNAGQNRRTDIRDQARLQIMLQYIQDHYQKNVSLEELARAVSLSKSSILNIFSKYVFISPIDYVIHYRLKRAAGLLETTEKTVSAVAGDVGFENTGYFCRKFKEVFSLTPSQYRKARNQSR